MTKEEKIEKFDPNNYATNDQLFGLPFNYEESDVIVLPVPWEVTVSYSSGTAKAPEAVKEASLQVDLYDPLIKDGWKRGVYMLPVNDELVSLNEDGRKKAETYLDELFEGSANLELLDEINQYCGQIVNWVREESTRLLDDGKKIILLGGDHSTPLGFIKALSNRYMEFGILQIDAHADLRNAYEGFEFSHASIMYNAIQLEQVSRLVQVGIRDYCDAENELIQNSDDRIVTFFDRDIKRQKYRGIHWEVQCQHIISKLPQKVYISFDIDGLDPKLCPNTGTPVAGGFEMEEVIFLLEKVVESGREIIGMDLNEISPVADGSNDWDANVGARLLYRLYSLMIKEPE